MPSEPSSVDVEMEPPSPLLRKVPEDHAPDPMEGSMPPRVMGRVEAGAVPMASADMTGKDPDSVPPPARCAMHPREPEYAVFSIQSVKSETRISSERISWGRPM